MFGCFLNTSSRFYPDSQAIGPSLTSCSSPKHPGSCFPVHPSPAWPSLEDGPVSFSWERQGALGCPSTMCRIIRELGAILPTAGLERMPKLGEEKKNLSPIPFRKTQDVQPSVKVSDGSVKPSAHWHSRGRSLFGNASAPHMPETQLGENRQSLICSEVEWTLDKNWFQNCLVLPKQ